MKEATFRMRADGNIVFHIALNQDGNLQPIINVRLPFGNIEVLKLLLKTERPGAQFYEVSEDWGYLFVYDNLKKKPYPSVMIWKFQVVEGQNMIVDMEQEDLGIIPYAVETYLREERRTQA